MRRVVCRQEISSNISVAHLLFLIDNMKKQIDTYDGISVDNIVVYTQFEDKNKNKYLNLICERNFEV